MVGTRWGIRTTIESYAVLFSMVHCVYFVSNYLTNLSNSNLMIDMMK